LLWSIDYPSLEIMHNNMNLDINLKHIGEIFDRAHGKGAQHKLGDELVIYHPRLQIDNYYLHKNVHFLKNLSKCKLINIYVIIAW
jgi:hypothetical protein